MMSVDWDVLIIGRSYAGLSAALNLGRARRSVLAVGSGGPRNESVFHAHGLITQDGASPGDIIAAAEKELNKYPTVELVDDRVTGLAEHWGRGVFTCAYCDGFEHGDTHLALTGSTFFVPPIARILTGWSPHVTAFSNDLDAAVRAELGAHGVNVDERPIARVNGDGNTVSSLELTDGTDVPIGALFVAEWPAPNNQLAVELGCAVDEHGYVDVDAMKRTTVPDVWAIGDVTSLRSNMSMSITDGVLAAVDCNTALLDRDWNETT